MIPFFTLILFNFAADDAFQPRLRNVPCFTFQFFNAFWALRGALLLADWEDDTDCISLEHFQENDIVFKWTADGHDRIMKHDSMIEFLQNNGNSETFRCPITRSTIPWNGVQKYRLMRDPQQFSNFLQN